MNLKSVMESDVAAFLNLDEFGDLHTVDNKSVVCVIDEDSAGEFVGELSDAAYVKTKRLYVRASDLVKQPRQGKRMDIDGDAYSVLSVAEEGEMLVITLTVNES